LEERRATHITELENLDPVTLRPPTTRIKDCASLNAIVKKIIIGDTGSALQRQQVQEMADGKPPFVQQFLVSSGQEGRCNLNWGDGKRTIKREMAGYIDLTESVPMLATIYTDFGKDPTEKAYFGNIISEEFNRTLKEWPMFHQKFLLLIQKFVTHGMGFLYFKDDVDWRWEVSGLEDFKVPRATTIVEDEMDIAVALREMTTGKLYRLIKDVEPDDPRWNLKEVKQAIIHCYDTQLVFSDGAWEKFEQILKNNDIYASTTAQDNVHLAHAWVREFSGKISQYLTLRHGGNEDFLFKVENLYESVNQCFNFFPYEIGSNGTFHAIRGKGHEIYPKVQELNSIQCQLADNAKLAGSLMLQPKTAADSEDMAITFYAGAVLLPPASSVEVQDIRLSNPSENIMPTLQFMSLSLENDAPAKASRPPPERRNKLEVKADIAEDTILPTAALDMFYPPWGRHLSEAWRRFRNPTVRPIDPGGKQVWEFRRRCHIRGVPKEAIFAAKRCIPYRAIGYGSPASRQAAWDSLLEFYGSCDPVGQNNLLRERFAQDVGWEGVDRFVTQLASGGRAPQDVEIAELQNVAMSAGIPMTVLPNDMHILHVQGHLPSLTDDLTQLESGQGSPQLLQNAQVKAQHVSQHMAMIKPDKLQEKVVAELRRQFNNASERVQAAMEHAERQQAKAQAQSPQQPPPPDKAALMAAEGQTRRGEMTKDATLKRQLRQQEADQESAIRDREEARVTRADAQKAAGMVPAPITSPAVSPANPAPAPAPSLLG
jgi:hypothetical protein